MTPRRRPSWLRGNRPLATAFALLTALAAINGLHLPAAVAALLTWAAWPTTPQPRRHRKGHHRR